MDNGKSFCNNELRWIPFPAGRVNILGFGTRTLALRSQKYHEVEFICLSTQVILLPGKSLLDILQK